MAELEIKKSRRARFESLFEHLLWWFRLVTILHAVMSLLGSVSCFVLGTQDEIHALNKLFNGYLDSETSILLLEKVIGGIDCFVIGIALLIFGYGVYELIISDIDPRIKDLSPERRNILNINWLESLKQKLTNIIVAALIVTAFKLMISLQVQTISELLQFCGCVLMLSLIAWVLGKNHNNS